MSGTQPRPKSQEAEDALTAALRELAARVKIIRIDVAGINSPEGDTLKDLILLALDGAAKVAAAHLPQPRRWLIEGLERPLRATRFLLPPTDPDAERDYNLRQLDGGLRALREALYNTREAAALVYPDVEGVPRRPGFDETEVDRMRVRAVLGRIDELERAVNRVGREAATRPSFVQQGELVVGYVQDMRVVIDQKRLILTVNATVVDLGALVSALETMLQLTDDFRASVNAWVLEIAEALFEAAGDLETPLRRLIQGVRDMGALIETDTGAEFAPDRPNMVLIRPGSFVMGISEAETLAVGIKHWDDHARPQHSVAISRLFLLGRYPVTRGEYAEFAQETGRTLESPEYEQNDRHPAVNVSFEDAAAYCEWLSERTGLTYRLPSEAEWEYACRAGTTWARWWGDKFDPQKANFNRKGTTEVDAFPANPWGLHDMLGNIQEWCADPWHVDYKGAPRDGSVWTTGGSKDLRVVRGGSWGNGSGSGRSGSRNGSGEAPRPWVGFRLSRTL